MALHAIPNADDSQICIFTLYLALKLQIFMLSITQLLDLFAKHILITELLVRHLEYPQCACSLPILEKQPYVLLVAHAPNLGMSLTFSLHLYTFWIKSSSVSSRFFLYNRGLKT